MSGFTRKERNRRAYAAAGKALRDSGLAFTAEESTLSYRVHGAHGLEYIVSPTTGRWQLIRHPTRLQAGGGGSADGMIRDHTMRRAEFEAMAKRKPEVTIFSDAARCQRGCAAWGGWIKANDHPSVLVGGEIEEIGIYSTEAEMRALANTLFVAQAKGFLKAGAAVMVQSDCVAVLAWIRKAHEPTMDRPAADGLAVGASRARKDSAGLTVFCDIAKRYGLLIITRHVKGHQEGDGRFWVNRQCDALAKKHLTARQIRAGIEPGTPRVERAPDQQGGVA